MCGRTNRLLFGIEDQIWIICTNYHFVIRDEHFFFESRGLDKFKTWHLHFIKWSTHIRMIKFKSENVSNRENHWWLMRTVRRKRFRGWWPYSDTINSEKKFEQSLGRVIENTFVRMNIGIRLTKLFVIIWMHSTEKN